MGAIVILRTRIIPSLLLQNESLVKTVNFKNYTYVGDPCNTVRIFNELEMKTFLQQELFRRGILWAAYHSISYAHKKKEIDKRDKRIFIYIQSLF